MDEERRLGRGRIFQQKVKVILPGGGVALAAAIGIVVRQTVGAVVVLRAGM